MDVIPTGSWACQGMPVGHPCVCDDGLTNGTCQYVGWGGHALDCVPGSSLGTTAASQTAASCTTFVGGSLMMLAMFLAAGSVYWWRRGLRAAEPAT